VTGRREPWRPIVVKIGGSLAETGRLKAILDIVAGARRPVVAVPGGGPFADAARAAQPRIGYSDKAAHEMALLAMHQMARAMADLEPRLLAAETVAAMRRAHAAARVPLWLPSRLALADPAIPETWTSTSDGLAAWLAARVKARAAILVKSRRADPAASAHALAAEGVVDPLFAAIVARSGLEWHIVGPGEDDRLASFLL